MEVEWTLGSVLAIGGGGAGSDGNGGGGVGGGGGGGGEEPHSAMDAAVVFFAVFVSLAAALLCLRVGFAVATGRKVALCGGGFNGGMGVGGMEKGGGGGDKPLLHSGGGSGGGGSGSGLPCPALLPGSLATKAAVVLWHY
jgi:hypothetical protein